MVEICGIKLNELYNNDDINRYMKFIPSERREQIKNFKHPMDIKRSLYGELLIRKIICNKFNMKNSEIIFIRNKFGKPFVKNIEYFNFNISHSGNIVICAMSNNKVGIDVEKIIIGNLDIAKRFFTMQEYNYLISQKKVYMNKYFYKMWTMKESYIKAVGKGLSISLNTCNIINSYTNKFIKFYEDFYFKTYYSIKKYCISICSYNDDDFCDIRLINEENFKFYDVSCDY